MQYVVRPTLVAMATKFGLGAEIQSPTGLSELLSAVMGTFGKLSLIRVSTHLAGFPRENLLGLPNPNPNPDAKLHLPEPIFLE